MSLNFGKGKINPGEVKTTKPVTIYPGVDIYIQLKEFCDDLDRSVNDTLKKMIDFVMSEEGENVREFIRRGIHATERKTSPGSRDCGTCGNENQRGIPEGNEEGTMGAGSSEQSSICPTGGEGELQQKPTESGCESDIGGVISGGDCGSGEGQQPGSSIHVPPGEDNAGDVNGGGEEDPVDTGESLGETADPVTSDFSDIEDPLRGKDCVSETSSEDNENWGE